jgi:hypothetical protein
MYYWLTCKNIFAYIINTIVEVLTIRIIYLNTNTKTIENHLVIAEIWIQDEHVIVLENKMYSKTYYHHRLKNVQIYETHTKVKVHELHIAT